MPHQRIDCLQASVGKRVHVKVGGAFTLADTDVQRPLLFVAGGIGVNPLFSMLSHAVYLASANAGGFEPLLFLYSY